ncbi:protein FAM241B isoform X2 [Vicugna pacos]|uniref:Protein FAM241B isoform X2 n=1 Tax=Vicugna pacos TaxID=30538 RepID=A0ABM5E2W1_VICPA
MVRILANGEIVQDDDPRVRTTTQPRSSTPRQSFLSRGHGAPLGGPGPRQQQAGARLGAAQSPFNDLNRQLVNMGFPQWHLGNHAVEPVTSILLLFLLMMLGEDPGDLDDLGVLAGGTVNVVPWRHLVEFPCRSMTSIPPSNHPPSCTEILPAQMAFSPLMTDLEDIFKEVPHTGPGRPGKHIVCAGFPGMKGFATMETGLGDMKEHWPSALGLSSVNV